MREFCGFMVLLLTGFQPGTDPVVIQAEREKCEMFALWVSDAVTGKAAEKRDGWPPEIDLALWGTCHERFGIAVAETAY